MAQPQGQLAQLVAGYGYICARTTNGQVKCWGYGRDGQLGIGDLGDSSSWGSKPEEMGANLPYLKFGQGRTAIDIATSVWAPYVCTVLSDGSVSCWGEQVATPNVLFF